MSNLFLMFKSYCIIAIRNIRRNLSYVLLNVSGLTISIASCLIIFLIVRSELGYDNFHRKADRTYRVTLNALDFNPSVSMGVVPALRTDFPELENVSQVWYQAHVQLKIGQNRYNEHSYMYVDEQFTSIFDYQWLEGNPRTALSEPNAVVLTQSMARKYFGDRDAMGQLINVDNRYNLRVTGIVKDPPGNTSLPFRFLVSFATVKKDLGPGANDFYNIMGGNAYIVLPEHYPVARLQGRMKAFIAKNWGADIARGAKLPLQPLRDIHFDQRYLNDAERPTTSRGTYYALAVVALFIIITACINFINLATAQATKRAREVGVRKALGAGRLQLIRQFMGETSLLVILSVMLAVAAAYFLLPQTMVWLGIKMDRSQLFQPAVMGLLAAITIVVILLAGLYPAFVQSAFQPALSLKGSTGKTYRGLTLRKSLVFLQFAISQILIIGTIVVGQQMDYFRNQDLGFNKETVIAFDLADRSKREVVRQQLLNNPGVADVCFSTGAPVYNRIFQPLSAPELGVLEEDVTETKIVDEHYIDMFAMKMLAGEKIARKSQGDTTYNVVVNESLVHKLGIAGPKEALGKQIIAGGQPCTITGVVQDFQSESKHKKIRPCVLWYDERMFFSVSVRIKPQHLRETISRIEKDWYSLFPDNLFYYEFLDDHIAGLYRQEQKVFTAFKLFSSLAILIGCLGLYGLVAFAAVQRTREVGIRKVLGASLTDIVFLFAKEFFLLIAIAFVAAAPVAWYVMHGWLNNFAYQVNIGPGIFLVALIISAMIAALTIGYQSVKAALANPQQSLRTD
jgi:ABC-type antimicrobial peptide transport system permease subunit